MYLMELISGFIWLVVLIVLITIAIRRFWF